MNWEHIITVILAAIPATIAALSSLRNGKKLDKHESTVYTLRSGKQDGNVTTESGRREWQKKRRV